MTAIFGTWSGEGHDAERLRDRQSDLLQRYGSGPAEAWECPDVALGRRLKATLPEDLFATAIHELDRRYAVVADVHLSERDDLVRSLGLDAAGLSDAAIVAAAIERWGEAAFVRIYGNFAVAAWDTRERRLILARDHIGDKPLFYARGENGLAFSSMPEGLDVVFDEPPKPDEQQYLRLLRLLRLSPGRTLKAGLNRVDPGHYVILTAQGETAVRYWEPDLTPLKLARQSDYEAALAGHFERSVASSLRGAPKQIAAHLSGGFDSTAVVTFAAEHLAATGSKIVAFTAVPKSGHFGHVMEHHVPDEGDLAAETAAMHANVEHVRVTPTGGTLDFLDRTSSLYDLPVRNLCNLTWSDAINDEARRRGLTVLLQGGRGNATLSESGVLALHALLREFRLLAWFRIANGLVRDGWMSWPGVVWNSVNAWVPLAWWRWFETRTGREPIPARRFSLLRQDVYDSVLEDAKAEADPDDARNSADFDEFAHGHVSSQRDRLAMISDDLGAFSKTQLVEWGIDLRDPTADRRLIEFALRVPVERLIWDGRPRAILRAVLAGRAPSAVIDAKKKGLQSADWHVSLSDSRERLLEEIERIEMFDPTAEFLDLDRLKKLAADMPAAGSPEWQTLEADLDYRNSLLGTVSVASHMRKTARSNY